MSNINVSYQELDSAAQQLSQGRQEIVDKLNQLQQQIDTLVTSGFVTEKASAAYQTAYVKFSTGARQTIDGIDELARFLRATSASIQELDSQLASRLNV